ncbi:hypothetical protein [Reinekea sp. G2M2-21]|uniref:hypothetical protein n=1 Tax=Reinekea sp. G2M2-21 TaxID=2788942 RepID=UPI0018AB110C|nr:hypothetical protein [Reinekea sp. G2M2-21]
MLVLILATLGYLLLNAVFIHWPFIPGLVTLVFWAGVGPALASISVWVFTKRAFTQPRSWIVVSGAMTVLFITAGRMSLYVIAQLWASV